MPASEPNAVPERGREASAVAVAIIRVELQTGGETGWRRRGGKRGKRAVGVTATAGVIERGADSDGDTAARCGRDLESPGENPGKGGEMRG